MDFESKRKYLNIVCDLANAMMGKEDALLGRQLITTSSRM